MANGLFGGGNGTQATPYLIEDAHDLNAVRNNLTAHYKLKNDIDMNVSPYNTGTGWTPIASFSGFFDGDFKTIKNLMINRPSENNIGIFKDTTSTLNSIKNAILDKFNIIGNVNVSCLLGQSLGNTKIENILILNSTLSASTINGLAGGVVAYSTNGDEVLRCGMTDSTINSYRAGAISSQFNSANCRAEDLYAINVSIDASNGCGGLFHNFGYVILKRCYFSGTLNSPSTGGVVNGAYNGGTVQDCFYNSDLLTPTKAITGVNGKTTSQLKNQSTFTNFDFNNTWILHSGKFPSLRSIGIVLNKILIRKSDGVYLYYDATNSQWSSIGTSPTDTDWLNKGVDMVTQSQLEKLSQQSITGRFAVKRL